MQIIQTKRSKFKKSTYIVLKIIKSNKNNKFILFNKHGLQKENRRS